MGQTLTMRDILLLRLLEVWGAGHVTNATRNALAMQLVVIPPRISALAKPLINERLAKWVWVRPEQAGRAIRVLKLTDRGMTAAEASRERFLRQRVVFEGEILLLSDLLRRLGHGSLTDALRIARLTNHGEPEDREGGVKSLA